jgi:hypothetical protein
MCELSFSLITFLDIRYLLYCLFSDLIIFVGTFNTIDNQTPRIKKIAVPVTSSSGEHCCKKSHYLQLQFYNWPCYRYCATLVVIVKRQSAKH